MLSVPCFFPFFFMLLLSRYHCCWCACSVVVVLVRVAGSCCCCCRHNGSGVLSFMPSLLVSIRITLLCGGTGSCSCCMQIAVVFDLVIFECIAFCTIPSSYQMRTALHAPQHCLHVVLMCHRCHPRVIPVVSANLKNFRMNRG